MSNEMTIRTVRQVTDGEIFLNKADLCKFIADAARECETDGGRDALVEVNLALMSMVTSKT